MRHFKTLVLCSLVAGLATPLLANDLTLLYDSYKKNGEEAPQWLINELFPANGVGSAIAALGGDDQGTAYAIPFGYNTSFSDSDNTAGGTDAKPSGQGTATICSYGTYSSSFGAPDKWYSFTLPTFTQVSAYTCNQASYDTCLGIFDANGTMVAADDDGSNCSGYSSKIETCCLPAGTYFLVVDGYNSSSSGAYTVTVDFGEDCTPAAVPNDACADAEPVGNGAYDFDTTDATHDGWGTFMTGPDAWYCYTATCDYDVTFSLCGSSYDTKLAVYDGCGCDEREPLASNDDACGTASEVVVSVLAGNSYLIQVGGYSSNTGAGTLTITPQLTGDSAANAIAMNAGDCVIGSTSCNTDQTGGYDVLATDLACEWVGFGPAASTGSSKDVWYAITLNGAAHTFSLENSSYDTALGVFDAATGAMVAGNDDNGAGGLWSRIECCTLPAGDYFVVVDGYGSASGNYELCVTECAPVEAVEAPSSFALAQNHPNPFNPTTSIEFSIDETSFASLKVFDLAGREVASLVNGVIEGGAHVVSFDASELSSGVYFYTLQANGHMDTKKMVLMK